MRALPIISALVLTAASGANATVYEMGLKGRLVAQTTAGSDPSWNVGDVITVKARFDDSRVFSFEGSDALFAGLYGLEGSGDQFFTMSGDGGVWLARDEMYDGYAVFYDIIDELNADGSRTYSERGLGSPAISFRNGKVSAFDGYMVPVSSQVPVVNLGSGLSGTNYCSNAFPGGPVSCDTTFYERRSDRFTVEGGTYLYANIYIGPDFEGRWDFEHSYVRPVPEPATWTMMTLGLGAAGATVRRRRESVSQVKA